MDLDEVKVFLVLAEELHFGRTAERLYLSPSRVSRQIAALERQVGGSLFYRSSRQVRLTPLGEELHQHLETAYAQLNAAFDQARDAAQAVTSTLGIGFTPTSGGEELHRLVRAFEARHPECKVDLIEVNALEPYAAIRDGEVDVLVNWLALDEPDLTAGPVLSRRPRMLAVPVTDPLAARESVSAEDLAGRTTIWRPPRHPVALFDAFIPPRTPSGRPIHRTVPWQTSAGIFVLVAQDRIVHPTVATTSPLINRPGLKLVPISDMPPMPLGLIWYTAHENARIRALAQTAAEEFTTPAPDRSDHDAR
jgi:DNA-binding transcriptional LysR family regulator